MITFLVCLTILIVGYFTYGKFVSNKMQFNDERQTPAYKLEDGVDYAPTPRWKVLLTQLLNIAGTGPIFGAVMGAMFGPAAFLWITFGTLFIGGVHDLLSGYMSLRHNGKSVPELVGYYLGAKGMFIMRIFTLVLLVLVGTVFLTAPADFLAHNVGMPRWFWLSVIMSFFILVTILPVKIKTAINPFFTASMLLMAILLFGALIIGTIWGDLQMVEITDIAYGYHMIRDDALGLVVFPFLFTTIACGAVSGFHSTQSPMMARCVTKESECRSVFYGSMVLEGIIALVWAAASMALIHFASSYAASVAVSEISAYLLGGFGIFLAVIAVAVAPITSGDTAFRSARLTLSDAFKLDQSTPFKRFLAAAPLFAIAFVLTFVDFNVIWRYFAWANQTLAAMVLWTGAAFLMVNKKTHIIASIPAAFLTAVSVSFIIQDEMGVAGIGFIADNVNLPLIGNVVGVTVALSLLVLMGVKADAIRKKAEITHTQDIFTS